MQTVDQILAYINSHGIDKVAPIVVSLVALAFSFLSYRQKDKEGKLGLRKQLTEILEKLTNLNVEDAKARSQSEDYPLNYTGIINDNRRFLVRQAAYLAMQWHDYEGVAGDRPVLRFPTCEVDALSEEFGGVVDRTEVTDRLGHT